ncbi:MAG: hypothetical protein SH868_03065 [Bythopirellula sp.]|nr:hypothetical protein [Bythopirellula sp.]
MGYTFPHDIQRQMNELMATGVFPSEDDLLRQAMSNLAVQQDDIAAIAASLRDFDNGERGCSAADSLVAVRDKLGLNS